MSQIHWKNSKNELATDNCGRTSLRFRVGEGYIKKGKNENQKGNDCKECYQAEGIYFTRYFRIDWNQTKLPVAQIHLWTGGEENE